MEARAWRGDEPTKWYTIADWASDAKRFPRVSVAGQKDADGNLDTCITLRTIIVKDGVAHVQAGAGVVADSVAASEHDETVNKARAALRAIALAHSDLPDEA